MKNGILPRRIEFKTAATPPVSDRRATPRIEIKRATVPFLFKAADAEARTFEGLLSVWGLDLGDDVMHPGAFKKTIREWKASPDAIPLLNSHNHFDVLSAFGQLLDAKETDEGLWTKWEVIPGDDGDRLLARLRPGSNGRSPVSKMSIGYEPTKVDFEESDEARFGQVRNLREVRLKEGSLVIFPMAPGARIDTTTVKSFLSDPESVDPTELTPEVRAELRRLSGRIGSLLARKDSDAPPPPAPTGKPKPAADATEDPEPATPPAAKPTAPASGTTTSTTDDPASPPDDESKGEPKYLFAEALQQRLLGLKIHAAAHSTGKIE